MMLFICRREYLLCFPKLFQDGNGIPFPGSKQEERFGTILVRVLEKHKDELLELGYEHNDIVVHSTWKGAATYASSGITAAPSSVSVNNRGGWTLEGVRDVYMLYERAGDQYVVRILSGMNILSAKFDASALDFFFHGTVGVPEAVAIVKKTDGVESKGFYHVESMLWRTTGFIVHQKDTTVWNSINASPF
jgi:hypothetical protein